MCSQSPQIRAEDPNASSIIPEFKSERFSIFAQSQTQMENLLDRITLNPAVCHGKPTIRNMRYPVVMILDLLSSGMNQEEIISDYPAIEKADILACLAYASRLVNVKSIHKIVV